MSNIQEQSIERREGPSSIRQLVITGRQTLIELNPEELDSVVGGAKPVVEITISPDGTIKIVQK